MGSIAEQKAMSVTESITTSRFGTTALIFVSLKIAMIRVRFPMKPIPTMSARKTICPVVTVSSSCHTK